MGYPKCPIVQKLSHNRAKKLHRLKIVPIIQDKFFCDFCSSPYVRRVVMDGSPKIFGIFFWNFNGR